MKDLDPKDFFYIKVKNSEIYIVTNPKTESRGQLTLGTEYNGTLVLVSMQVNQAPVPAVLVVADFDTISDWYNYLKPQMSRELEIRCAADLADSGKDRTWPAIVTYTKPGEI